MSISSALDRIHSQAKRNSWLWLFSIFNRFALALGFIPAGLVKIMDERFASGLSANHPMGHYLEALHLTGFYYTFIGIAQIAAAVMLLVPRTVTLGAFLYFPIILNICILTYATRFDGSLFTAPLMTLANLFLLAWNYEKWKYVLPFNHLPVSGESAETISPEAPARSPMSAGASGYGISWLYARFLTFFRQLLSDRFPALFFTGVFAAVVICAIGIPSLYRVKPRNTFPQCIRQFNDSRRTAAGNDFCRCIHNSGNPLNQCLNEYQNAPDDAPGAP